MKKAIFRISISLVIVTAIIGGCKEDEIDHGAPTLAFAADSGYLYSDTAVSSGDTAIMSLKCTWNGADLIQTIKTYLNGNLVGAPYEIKDSVGKELTYYYKITKSLNPIEYWEFEVTDSKGHISKLGLNIYNDNSGSKYIKISATLGVQKNPAYGSYYSFTINKDYMEPKAQLDTMQQYIDLLGGYDYDDFTFISSPGSTFSYGVYDLNSWTTKNLTQFCTTSLTKSQYDLISDDNMLKSSFHPEKAVDYIVKFKKNDIYSFKTQSGKYGLMLILSVATSEYGYFTFDAKIQE